MALRHTTASFQQGNSLVTTNDDYKRQADVPAAVDGTWHIALLCQFLVCSVLSLNGKETHADASQLCADGASTMWQPSCGGGSVRLAIHLFNRLAEVAKPPIRS